MSFLRIAKKDMLSAVFGLMVCSISVHSWGVAGAADWPRWRGSNLDAVCSETGLLKEWPEGGPKLLWEMTGLGRGYSSVAIANGILYTMGDRSVGAKTEWIERSGKLQCLVAYDLTTRKELWAAIVGPPHDDGGPRGTPAVHDGLVYGVGTSGDVVCADAKTGDIRWRKNLVKEFGGKNPGWRYSESPLVDGDRLVCTPGGRDAVMVALNRRTGELIWKCSMPDIGRNGKDEAGYSSIVIANGGGVRQYVQLTNKGLIGVSAEDGTFLWGYNKIANGTANIPTPVVRDEYVFCSTAYGAGSALLRLAPGGDSVKAEEVYFLDSNTFQNHHGGFVRIGDYIYGGHGHGKGKPTCIEMKTGKVMWQENQPGGGSAAVLYADGHLYFRYEDNVMALVEADPQSYNLRSTFKLPRRDGMSGPGWAHLVIADGRLYVRHSDVLFVYDVKAENG